jgi:uncharacterized protein YceH (UPF0502 family)
MHLLSGAVESGSASADAPPEDFIGISELAALKTQQAALQQEVSELRRLVERLYAELGVDRGSP